MRARNCVSPVDNSVYTLCVRLSLSFFHKKNQPRIFANGKVLAQVGGQRTGRRRAVDGTEALLVQLVADTKRAANTTAVTEEAATATATRLTRRQADTQVGEEVPLAEGRSWPVHGGQRR